MTVNKDKLMEDLKQIHEAKGKAKTTEELQELEQLQLQTEALIAGNDVVFESQKKPVNEAPLVKELAQYVVTMETGEEDS